MTPLATRVQALRDDVIAMGDVGRSIGKHSIIRQVTVRLDGILAALPEGETPPALPPEACWNCKGRGVLNFGLGENDTDVWVPPYPCPLCHRTGLNEAARGKAAGMETTAPVCAVCGAGPQDDIHYVGTVDNHTFIAAESPAPTANGLDGAVNVNRSPERSDIALTSRALFPSLRMRSVRSEELSQCTGPNAIDAAPSASSGAVPVPERGATSVGVVGASVPT